MEPAPRRSSQRLHEKPRPKGNTTVGSRRTTRTSRLHVKRKTPVYTSSSEEQVDQSNRRRRPKPKGLRSITTLDPKNDPSPGETSPTNISQPISALVNPALRGAWVINKSVNVCYNSTLYCPPASLNGVFHSLNRPHSLTMPTGLRETSQRQT